MEVTHPLSQSEFISQACHKANLLDDAIEDVGVGVGFWVEFFALVIKIVTSFVAVGIGSFTGASVVIFVAPVSGSVGCIMSIGMGVGFAVSFLHLLLDPSLTQIRLFLHPPHPSILQGKHSHLPDFVEQFLLF